MKEDSLCAYLNKLKRLIYLDRMVEKALASELLTSWVTVCYAVHFFNTSNLCKLLLQKATDMKILLSNLELVELHKIWSNFERQDVRISSGAKLSREKQLFSCNSWSSVKRSKTKTFVCGSWPKFLLLSLVGGGSLEEFITHESLSAFPHSKKIDSIL